MKYLGNRDCIIIRPKKAFCDWVNGYDESKVPDEDLLASSSMYLVDDLDYPSEENVRALIGRVFEEILVNEAYGWYEDDEYIPAVITLELFNEWFEWDYCDLIHDMGRGKILFEE